MTGGGRVREKRVVRKERRERERWVSEITMGEKESERRSMSKIAVKKSMKVSILSLLTRA